MEREGGGGGRVNDDSNRSGVDGAVRSPHASRLRILKKWRWRACQVTHKEREKRPPLETARFNEHAR